MNQREAVRWDRAARGSAQGCIACPHAAANSSRPACGHPRSPRGVGAAPASAHGRRATGYGPAEPPREAPSARSCAPLLRPGCEIHIGPGFALDAEPIYRGHAGWRALLRLWDEAVALSFVAEEMLDMGGPCYALLVSVNLTGIKSGASTPPVQAVWTYTLSRGLVVRQDVRHDGWDTAPAGLAAALARVSPAAETPSSTPARGQL